MTNFCGNCGTVIPEGSAVCPNCGAAVAAAPVAAEAQAPKANPLEALKGKKNILVAAVAAVLVVVLAILLFGSSPKAAAKKYLNAQTHFNAKGIYNSYHKEVMKERLDAMDKDKKEYLDDTQDSLDDMKDEIKKEYDKYSPSVKIIDVWDVKNSEAKEYKDMYDEQYDLKVKDVKEVRYVVTTKIKDDGDKDLSVDVGSVMVGKIGGKWYVLE